MLKISKRLQAVASLVPKGAVLADVGTDHGYVPIWLLQKKQIPSAIGMDINRGPLQRAVENRDKYGLKGLFDLRLSDGLSALSPGEADAILIAGMGGLLMQQILERGRKQADCADSLILSPQSDIPSVRKYLITRHYHIEDEIMILDEGKYYIAMKVVHGQEKPWSETEYLFGKRLLEKREPLLQEYLYKEKKQYIKIQQELESKERRASQRYTEVCRFLEFLEQGLRYFENKKEDVYEG